MAAVKFIFVESIERIVFPKVSSGNLLSFNDNPYG
jgi:hypothetical protein